MKTALNIKTNERIFLIHYNFDMGKKDLCNLSQLEGLVKNCNGVQMIQSLWNYKFTRISKKDLKAMLKSQDLSDKFLELY